MPLNVESIPKDGPLAYRLLTWHQRTDKIVEILPHGSSRVLPDLQVGWHHHKEIQLTLFTKGTGVWQLGNHIGSFSAPTAVLIGSHLPHGWDAQEETSGYTLQIQLAPQNPLWKLGFEQELQKLNELAMRIPCFDPLTYKEILARIQKMESVSAMARVGHLVQLLDILVRSSEGATSKNTMSTLRPETSHPGLQRTIRWILDNFQEPLTVSDAVKMSSMSRATFNRQFSRHTGKSFVTFLNDARLAHAHLRLIQSQDSVAEIAFESGFGSLTRFHAAFRKAFTDSPTVVRKKAQSFS